MRKVELLPTRDCEAGYGPGALQGSFTRSQKVDRSIVVKVQCSPLCNHPAVGVCVI